MADHKKETEEKAEEAEINLEKLAKERKSTIAVNGDQLSVDFDIPTFLRKHAD